MSKIVTIFCGVFKIVILLFPLLYQIKRSLALLKKNQQGEALITDENEIIKGFIRIPFFDIDSFH